MEEINLNGQKFRIAVYNRQGNERKDLTKEVVQMIWTPEKVKHQQKEWRMLGVNQTRQRFKLKEHYSDRVNEDLNAEIKKLQQMNSDLDDKRDIYLGLSIAFMVLCAFNMAGFLWALTYIHFL